MTPKAEKIVGRVLFCVLFAELGLLVFGVFAGIYLAWNGGLTP